MQSKTQIPVIILAAGSSSRLGKPKQLLEYEGETLLNRTIKIASAVSKDIIVVLGANFEKINSSISNKNVTIVFNENWESGLASSIIAGLKNRLTSENVIISLCDQPYLESSVFQKLIAQSNFTKKPIVASNYGSQVGVPILFNQSIYNNLLNLKGDKGARSILGNYKDTMVEIDFPNGHIDIDTIEDWDLFLALLPKNIKNRPV